MNFWNRASFSDKVLRGDLDKYLARPVHPLFALAAEDVHLAMFLKYFIPPLVMAVIFVRAYSLPVTFFRFVGGYLLLSAGKLVLTMMRAAASMAAFKHGDVSGLQSVLFQFTILGGYPTTEFPKGFQFLLGYVLPAALPPPTQPCSCWEKRMDSVSSGSQWACAPRGPRSCFAPGR